MTDTERTTVFAGVDGRTNTDLPEWFAAETEMDTRTPCSFAHAIRALPRATETTVAYKNTYTDEWVETERFNAIVEPSRLIAHAHDDRRSTDLNSAPPQSAERETEKPSAERIRDGADPLFHIPSNSYAIINPTDVYAPLEDVLRTIEVDGRALGEVVFGEIREYRGGGEVHMDVMFDGLEVTLPGRTDPITLGVTSGYDFFGEQAVYVEGFARDSYCSNSIRALTDREVVKHVGTIGDFEAWWKDILGQLDLIADDLVACIEDAQRIEIDFTAMPFDVEMFYDLLEFPDYLAQRAAEDARVNAPDPFTIDMWSLHSGATYALTHFFRGKEGNALQRYQRIANDILFNPDATVTRVETAYEQRLKDKRQAADGERQQTGHDESTGLAQIERVSDDLQEKAEQFETREEALRDRFQAVTE